MIHDFKEFYSILKREGIINEMKKTCHSFNCDFSNPYHREETIWNHTLLVLGQCFFRNIFSKDLDLLMIAALFHDTGKPFRKLIKEDKKKVNFSGHWIYSSNLLRVIYFSNSHRFNISKREIWNLYKVIALHHLHNLSKDIRNQKELIFSKRQKELFNRFKICDVKGRIAKKKIDFKSLEGFDSEVNQREIFTSRYSIINDLKSIQSKENKPLFILPIGSSGSGKSYLTQELKSEFDIKSIERDRVRYDLYKELNPDEAIPEYQDLDSEWYHKIWTATKDLNQKQYQRIFGFITENKRRGNNILIDSMNISYKSRKRYLSYISKENYTRVGIFFFTNTIFQNFENNQSRKVKQSGALIKNTYYDTFIPLIGVEFDYILIL